MTKYAAEDLQEEFDELEGGAIEEVAEEVAAHMKMGLKYQR